MIKVRVENFQSIGNQTVEIDGFTVVTGTNNTGKSALMRAIHAVFTNPAPGSIVRHGASHAEVEITFNDGRNVVWKKGAKINEYWIDGAKLGESAGRGVPAEVLDLGYRPIEAGGKKLWPQFAKQKSGDLFLLDLPGSAIADAVANVERIRVLNHALKSCESERRSVNSDLKLRRKDSEKLDERFVRFEGLDEAVALLDGLEESRTKGDKVVKLHKILSSAQVKIDKAKAEVERHEGFGDAKGKVPDKERLTEIRDIQTERKDLAALEVRLTARREMVDKWGAAVEIAANNRPGEDEAVVKANKLRQGRKVLGRLQKGIEDEAKKVSDLQTLLIEKRKELETAEENVHAILGDYEECPTCGTHLKGEQHVSGV